MSNNSSTSQQIPVSTQWTLDAAGEIGRAKISNVFMIVCPDTNSKGTGFLLENGCIVTNKHVTTGALPNIIGFSSTGQQIKFSEWYYDINGNLDLILLKPTVDIAGGLSIEANSKIEVGESVHTWGFPLGYNGPNPLLSVGYLSGFSVKSHRGRQVKHLVVNGAFNNGNSGGALFKQGGEKVVGIVVTKHAPLTQSQTEALKFLSQNKSGLIYIQKDAAGNEIRFSEAQLIADILNGYHKLVQVMIGEAICSSELVSLIRYVANEFILEAKNKKLTDKNLAVSFLNKAKKMIDKIISDKDLNELIESELQSISKI